MYQEICSSDVIPVALSSYERRPQGHPLLMSAPGVQRRTRASIAAIVAPLALAGALFVWELARCVAHMRDPRHAPHTHAHASALAQMQCWRAPQAGPAPCRQHHCRPRRWHYACRRCHCIRCCSCACSGSANVRRDRWVCLDLEQHVHVDHTCVCIQQGRTHPC